MRRGRTPVAWNVDVRWDAVPEPSAAVLDTLSDIVADWLVEDVRRNPAAAEEADTTTVSSPPGSVSLHLAASIMVEALLSSTLPNRGDVYQRLAAFALDPVQCSS